MTDLETMVAMLKRCDATFPATAPESTTVEVPCLESKEYTLVIREDLSAVDFHFDCDGQLVEVTIRGHCC